MFDVSRVCSVRGREETGDGTGILESAVALGKYQPGRYQCNPSPLSVQLCLLGCNNASFHYGSRRLSSRGGERAGQSINGGKRRTMSEFSCWSIGKFYLFGWLLLVCRVFNIYFLLCFMFHFAVRRMRQGVVQRIRYISLPQMF